MNGSIFDQLPEPILHKILSLLSQKDAVRTCVLSKSWRHLWYARPIINFRRSDFEGICRCSPKTLECRGCLDEKKIKFRLALDKTLQRYHDQKLSIENFELEMFEVDSQWISLLQKWIPILIVPDMLLETFSLCFTWGSFSYFELPWVVFQVKSLRKLCLERCKLVNTRTISLECLQTLILKNVFMEVDTLEMFMSSCPLIENVVLEECDGLRGPKVVIRVKHNNLKHFTFSAYLRYKNYYDSPGIEIDAPNIISLSLQDVQLYANSFENLSSNLPRLEDLSVLWCKCHGELKLSSRSIRRLTLAVEIDSIKATINTPNLHDFKFMGEFRQTSLITFTTTLSEWESHVEFDVLKHLYDDRDLPWFRNLGELLRALSKSQISLDAGYEVLSRKQHIEEGYFNHELVVVENLRLFLSEDYDYPSLPHFLNGLFSICRPRYTQTLKNDNQLFHFLCKVLVQERGKKDYYWQKYLEDVDMEVWDMEINEWNPTSLPHCKMPSKQNIRFLLKWSDSFSLHTVS